MTPHVIIKQEIGFPRFEEDIVSGKRTLCHLLAWFTCVAPAGTDLSAAERVSVGDVLLLHPSAGFNNPRRIVAVASKVDLVPLEVSDADLPLLNMASIAEYIARWDRIHPERPYAQRPMVWRIEWRYDIQGWLDDRTDALLDDAIAKAKQPIAALDTSDE